MHAADAHAALQMSMSATASDAQARSHLHLGSEALACSLQVDILPALSLPVQILSFVPDHQHHLLQLLVQDANSCPPGGHGLRPALLCPAL